MGYCDSPQALVYEFMAGGSLYHRLHDVSIVDIVLRGDFYSSYLFHLD